MIQSPRRSCSWLAPLCLIVLSMPLALSLAMAGTAASAEAGSQVALSSIPTDWFCAYLPMLVGPRPTPCHQYLPALYDDPPPTPTPSPTPRPDCPTGSTAQWGSMAPVGRSIVGAAQSPDLNLNVRGWYRVRRHLGFSRYAYPPDAPPDHEHPLHLSNIVAGSSGASFVSTYQVNDWDWWHCGCGVPRSDNPYPTTMLGLRTTPGAPLRIASRNIAVGYGYNALVLFADAHQVALKYTDNDSVDEGYLVHLVDICVDTGLVQAYQRLNAAGRQELPAVFNDSVVGSAWGDEVDVVVRDSGSFMDPRSWQDWWQDQPYPFGPDQ